MREHAARGRRQDLSLHEQRAVVHPPADGQGRGSGAQAAAATATRATARRSCRTGGFICRRRRHVLPGPAGQEPSADPMPPQPQGDRRSTIQRRRWCRSCRTTRCSSRAASRRTACGCSMPRASCCATSPAERRRSLRSMAAARSRRWHVSRRPTDAGHECALVTCKVGDLTGTARVRIVPPLPWKFDFNDVGQGAAHLDRRPGALGGSRARAATSIWPR